MDSTVVDTIYVVSQSGAADAIEHIATALMHFRKSFRSQKQMRL